MKEFDDYWEENWNEQDWAGCKRACRLCYEDAKKKGIKEGMLAAADIADSSVFPFGIRSSKDSVEYAIGNNIGAIIRKAAYIPR